MFGNIRAKHHPLATTALDALAAHVMIADEDLTIVYVNPALSALLGRVEEDLRKELPRFSMATLVGSNIDVFHARPAHQRSLLKNLSQPHSATIRVGQLVFDLRVMPLATGRKRKGFVVEWADARERLLNLDYSAQIAAIGRSQAVVAFTAAGTIISANANFLSVMGYTMEEIQGQHHSLFVEAEVRNSPDYGTFWNELRQGHAPSGEYRRVAKGGRIVWVQGSYNPILDEKGKVTKVVKFVTDVTPRIRSVADVAAALAALSQGDLERRIDRALIPELDKLRLDFNAAVDTLQKTMHRVGHAAEAIHGGSGEIRAHADDLARRTEQQAASLEQTAAALDEITATVKATAGGATNARAAVECAKTDAEHSGAVVSRAIDAMTAIETSSRQISQIIGVIDEIAFQTNLLALNAGVEAARAGDAGRGFAVVASEVRALAQRSAEAAKEIKALIMTSTEQVSAGVGLVGETGRTLKRIVTQVTEINAIVSDIAASAREQASGLSEVNTAVNQMDQVTQQNAAMVEESTAASHNLATETERLASLIRQFKIGRAAPAGDAAPEDRDRRETRPALKVMGRGGAARHLHAAPETADAGWEEF